MFVPKRKQLLVGYSLAALKCARPGGVKKLNFPI